MWYKKYGLDFNPFFVRPSPNIVNLEKEREVLESYVLGENISAIVGPHGSGKTSLLLWLLAQKKGERLLYLNGIETDTKERLEMELLSKRSFWDKLLRRRLPKNVILLLDEAQAIEEQKFFELLRTYWDEKTLIAVVMSFSDSIKLSPGLTSRLGDRIIHLGSISPSTVSDLVKLRTNNKIRFDSDALESIAKTANYNPRKILEFCERCAVEFAGKKERINIFDVQSTLRHILPVRQVVQKDILPKPVPVRQEKEVPKIFLTAPTEEARQEIRQEVRQLGKEMPKNLPKFSPLQSSIIAELKNTSQTLRSLSLKLGKPIGSIGKELSRLVRQNVVIKISEEKPKRYSLSDSYSKFV